MSLVELQNKLLQEREKILKELKDEWARKEISEKLELARQELEEVNELVEKVKANAEKNLNAGEPTRNAKVKGLRKRANPEFKRLGIEVPVGQRPGNSLEALGTKIKKNRKSRKASRNSKRV
jgi:hypothetical protein